MGTEKRERQKSNRALKLEQEQREARTRQTRRKILRAVAIVVIGLAGVVLIAWIGGAFDSDQALAPAPTTTVPADDADTAPDTDDAADTADDADDADTGEVAPDGCPATDGSESQRREFSEPPPMCLTEGTQYSAVVTTNFGEYTIEFDAEQAPLTVNNFVTLARYQYFDDTECHRIIPDFVVQCGDPTASGTGGPGYRFDDELPEPGQYELGSVAMANSGPDTNGSQFFIISGPDGAALPPNFSLFGQVTDGLDTVAAMDAAGTPGGDPSETVRIETVEIVTS